LYYTEKKLNKVVRFFLYLPCREIPTDGCAILVDNDDEARNESTAEPLKTRFLTNDCRSCFFIDEE
jgi:hypothetical protein